MPGALPAVTVPDRRVAAVLAVGRSKTGLSRASASAVESRRGTLVDRDDRLAAFRVADRDGRHLGIEPAGVDRGDRLLVARQREGVLVGAARRGP